MSPGKTELIEIANLEITRIYQHNNIDITKNELNEISAMTVELGGAQIIEVFSPQRFNK